MADEFDPSVTLVHWNEGGTVVASNGNLMVQLRVGELTEEIIERVETQARLVRASTRGPSAALIVVTESAPLADGSLRERQGQLVVEFLRDPRTRMALVIEGDSVPHTMARAAARTSKTKNLQVFGTVTQAGAWLSPHIERDARGVTGLVAQVRPLAQS